MWDIGGRVSCRGSVCVRRMRRKMKWSESGCERNAAGGYEVGMDRTNVSVNACIFR